MQCPLLGKVSTDLASENGINLTKFSHLFLGPHLKVNSTSTSLTTTCQLPARHVQGYACCRRRERDCWSCCHGSLLQLEKARCRPGYCSRYCTNIRFLAGPTSHFRTNCEGLQHCGSCQSFWFLSVWLPWTGERRCGEDGIGFLLRQADEEPSMGRRAYHGRVLGCEGWRQEE